MCKYCNSEEEPICGDCLATNMELDSERRQKAQDDYFEWYGHY